MNNRDTTVMLSKKDVCLPACLAKWRSSSPGRSHQMMRDYSRKSNFHVTDWLTLTQSKRRKHIVVDYEYSHVGKGNWKVGGKGALLCLTRLSCPPGCLSISSCCRRTRAVKDHIFFDLDQRSRSLHQRSRSLLKDQDHWQWSRSITRSRSLFDIN